MIISHIFRPNVGYFYPLTYRMNPVSDAYVGVGEGKSSVAIGGTSESPQSGA